MTATALLLLLLGLLVGLGVGAWLGPRLRGSGAAPGGLVSATELARAATERDVLRAESDRLRRDLATQAALARDAELEVARVTTALERSQVEAEQRLGDLRRTQEELTEQFRLVSHDVVQRAGKQLLELTEERQRASDKAAAAELEQRRQAVAGLVKPIEDHLQRVASQIDQSEQRRAQAFATLTEQVRQMGEVGSLLRHETEALKTALRRPEIRGSWGEQQLRAVVELAGMVEYCDFTTQETVTSDDGKRRPDMVVRLAGDRKVVVDAKVSISAFYDALNTSDESVRTDRLAAHARHVRTHVEQLGAKSYWALVTPSPEFVIAFVPGEAMLAQALETDPSLMEYATSKGVVLAGPLTLIATLRTVAYTWKETRLAENAQQVFDEGRGLYKRLGRMGEHLDRLGRSLTSSVKAYNQAVGSLERQVLPSARRLHELDVTDAEITPPAPVEEPVRPLSAAELVTVRDQRRPVRALPSRHLGMDELEVDPRYGVDPLPLSDDVDDSAARRLSGDGA
jgi:DNA recombination protein RmuC